MDSGEIPSGDFIDAIGGGAMRALFETKDFLFGETPPAEQSDIRQRIEARTKSATDASLINSVGSTISQFATGMLGAGKILRGLELVPKVGEAITAGVEAAPRIAQSLRAASVGAVAFDPHKERLSNLAEQVPVIGEPLFGWLAAHPEDSNAFGRMKAALESIGLDAALAGSFLAAGKVYKAIKSGSVEEVHAATEELQAAQEKVPPEPTATSTAETPDSAPVGPAGEVKPAEATTGAPAGEAPVAAPRTAANENPPGPPHEPNTGATVEGAPAETPPLKEPAITPEDAERVIAQTQADIHAIDEYGSVGSAAASGHSFAPQDGIPWQKLTGPAEVDAFTARVADTLGQEHVVLTDASVQRRVQGMASYFNIDPGTIVGRVLKAGDDATKMVANMEAAYLLSQRMHMDAFTLANRIGLGDYAGFATREAAVAEFQRQVSVASSMFASGQNMRAAFGQGLRRLRPEFAVPQGLVDSVNALGGEKLMQLFRNTLGDPDKLKLATQPSFLKKAAEELGFVVQNNLLWGWGTHVVNTIGNIVMVVERPTERIIGGTIQQLRGQEGGAEIRQEAIKQFTYMARAWVDGLPSVWNALKASEGVLDPRRTGAAGEANRDILGLGLNSPEWKPMDSTYNVLHNAFAWAMQGYPGRNLIAIPTRVLTAADEMAKQTVYRSYTAAKANMEGAAQGLEGKDLAAFVKQKVNGAFDETGMAIDKQGIEEARIATFSQDLQPGTVGAWVRQGVAQHPLFRLVLPYTQTPTNIFRYTAKLSPGANLLQTEFRDQLFGRMGAEAQANAMGQLAIGTLALPAIAFSGLNLTGGGPMDAKVRSELMATGWRPYSLVVEDKDGTRHYLPIGRVDPIALPFGIIADIHDYLNTGADASKVQAAISALTFGLIKQVANKTYLQSIVKAAEAFTDPEEGRHLLKFAQGVETMVFPFSSLLRTTNPDPFMREARNLTDALVAITPGLSETLPAKHDGLGQPIRSRNTFMSSAAPDPVTREMQRLEMNGYTIPPATPTQNHADLRDVTMVDGRNAFEVYQQLGGKPTDNARPLKDVIGEIMASKAYAKAPDGYSNVDGTKLWLLTGPVAQYRKAALTVLQRDKNVREALQAEQRRVIGAYKTANDPKAAAKGPLDTLKDIGASFGVQLP